jgi:hypothetical protein
MHHQNYSLPCSLPISVLPRVRGATTTDITPLLLASATPLRDARATPTRRQPSSTGCAPCPPPCPPLRAAVCTIHCTRFRVIQTDARPPRLEEALEP